MKIVCNERKKNMSSYIELIVWRNIKQSANNSKKQRKKMFENKQSVCVFKRQQIFIFIKSLKEKKRNETQNHKNNA